MEMLAFYIPGLCFHPLHFHCLLSITVLPAFIQYLQPECLFVTTSRRYFTVYLSVITSLLKTLSRDPLLSHWRPMWFAFPFQLFVLNHLLGEPYTPPELNTCSLPNTTFLWPFWFYTCCSIHLSYLPSNSSSENVVVFQGSAQICFCYEDALMALIHQVIPSSVASHIIFIDPRMHSLGCIRCLCFSTQQSEG